MPRLQSEFFKKCKYDRDEFDGAWIFLSPLTISQKMLIKYLKSNMKIKPPWFKPISINLYYLFII